jgi:hypothetical protein
MVSARLYLLDQSAPHTSELRALSLAVIPVNMGSVEANLLQLQPKVGLSIDHTAI